MTIASGMVMGMVALRMSQTQPLNKPTHLAIDRRADHQMPVIGHQAESEKAQVHALYGIDEDSFKGLVVGYFVKYLCTVAGTIEHMIDRSSLIRPLGSAHHSFS